MKVANINAAGKSPLRQVPGTGQVLLLLCGTALVFIGLFSGSVVLSAETASGAGQNIDGKMASQLPVQPDDTATNGPVFGSAFSTELCRVPFGPPALTGFAPAAAADATTITAKSTVAKQGESFVMEGDVHLQRGDLRMRADQLTYLKSTETVTANGAVEYEVGGFRMSSSRAEFNVAEQSGEIAASNYWIPQRHLRGQAGSIRLESSQVLQLNDATLTSCEEGKTDWLLKASELRLDRGKNEGIAKHARLEFMQVPFFYFPYLSFPIEGRKTGFLVPDYGSSDSNGTELGLPWYWNIAPNRDATFTPHYFSERGLQLQSEFRYLNKANAGQLDLVYLQDDDKYNDDRYFSRLQHDGRPASGWTTRIDASRASDGDYLDDFGGELTSSSLTHLEQRLSMGYQAAGWHFNSLLETYQTMDDTLAATSRPYRRLPQIVLYSDNTPTISGVSANINTEFVDFDREEGVVGRRVDIQPRISWNFQRSAGFAKSGLSLRHTRYRLENNQSGSVSAPSRSLPIFSLDSGLFFERELASADSPMIQTLEPRLFYLYVPYRDQSNLTVFDSGMPQLGFDQLFRDNRFSGVDRAGDANQLTVALTSRLYSGQGREMFSASLGQIRYFSDRKVTLPGQAEESFNRSDVVAELRTHWNQRVESSASLLVDSENNRNARGSFKFRYQQDKDRIAHLAWRYERDPVGQNSGIDQADVSVLWPLYKQWKAAGRWYYSFHDEVPLERLVGIEYESCCWALRLVSRDYISNSINNTTASTGPQDRNKSIWLQLELKGLASVGKKTKELFTTGRLD